MQKLAMKDAYNQQDLARKAKLQVDLFQKAQDFAKEVGIQEMKAKQYAQQLKETTDKAQKARMLMFQAATQARILSDRMISFISPSKCIGINCPPTQSLIPAQVERYVTQASISNMSNKFDDFNQTSPQNIYNGMLQKVKNDEIYNKFNNNGY
jgi:hypothetical protein